MSSTRERILDGAAQVMRSRGLARATTKEIAKQAGYSEATLYKHFRDKTELFIGVLHERVPGELAALLAGLGERAGEGAVTETLEEVAQAALDFYGETFPMAAALFAEPELLAAHRSALYAVGAGPHAVRDAVAGYLAAEQAAGGIAAAADPEAAAALLLGACLQQAFLGNFAGDPAAPEGFAARLVRTLSGGLGV
ncbi:TetR/AcrR family transcriptional regulator [Sciscionella sediminilitoris]|uniref:TetR/AcrR family transcriptional regulator n=1 Tax=Sciscionella sediminilitoris TaxID=1445613 RepID=UPI000AFCC4CF|nr:helix-turn-helix domain-containing protein [Sciscionella sp. SE31]